jgi:hypothetical protein
MGGDVLLLFYFILFISTLFFFFKPSNGRAQIADGDIGREVAIPIHMIFPRLFTCPTLATDNFKIGAGGAARAIFFYGKYG